MSRHVHAPPAQAHPLHGQLHEAGPSDAAAALRARGVRLTAPRRAVLSALAGRADYLTAEEVAALVDDDDVHRATVYRTLELFAETGVVAHRQAPGSAARYHLVSTGAREHLHGHCRGCGAVVVLHPDALDAVAVAAERDTGFVLDVARSSLVGLCAACAAASDAMAVQERDESTVRR